ncbi:citrate synthase/methylcitrate synthase [Sphingomonas adhaesiva]|uniref:citrate synthase/methylcitrate synthase n=1 Tax=Sphingomonas adhaesiva TaxID=28212 RepID=UPI002FF4755B
MAIGLDEVVAAETVLSDVDGARGQLVIRGHRLDDLAGRTTFEEVVALLFDGFLPLPADVPVALGAARIEAFAMARPLLPLVRDRPVYDAMRAVMAMLPDGTTTADALRLVAAPAVLIPALLRQAGGAAPIAPDAATGHAADVVRMLGHGADGARAAALDTYLVTVCDHGLNASTFAARVVASTAAGLTSAVLAGLGALKGPLHGGAPGPVLDMLDAIAQAGDARAWLSHEVARGERLMGFGHRIYRVRDPRADALKAAVARLPQTAGRLDEAQAIEAIALDVLRAHRPGRVLETNVEFYTALLLEAVGFPREAFTGVFAMGRVAGWIAHAREQALTGRLIRPQSRYIPPSAAAA